MTNRTVKVGGYSFNTIIGYTDGAYGTNSTTGLLRHMFQENENFVYYYDNVGNISYMYRTGKYTGYVYDNLGQLIRVNDETDTTSGAAGTTWTYEYDRGGNIISKSRYAYTTGVLGTALETIVYGYGDYNWMDKMTHYNYMGVSYDDIGNPTSFNGWTCTWEKGRQLKEMTDNSVNTIYYKYNADGLRVQKRKVTIYGSDVTTNYILHGKNIVHMTQGTDTLHFWYDAQGRPAIVDYNGTKYAYIHNLQGDIVGIIDSTGAEVVQYTYDAWGKVLSTAGTMASTLGTVQPFRYRGYVYDVETGLYYLRSRYYNPEWGRFINADSLIKGNLFAYCGNDSINYLDGSGHKETRLRDITELLNSLMENAYNFIDEGLGFGYSLSEYLSYCFIFAEKVKSNGEWDLKTRNDLDINYSQKYLYEGIVILGDEPGNIMFGYVGARLFNLYILQRGAGEYQKYQHHSQPEWDVPPTYGDEPRDNVALTFGYYLSLYNHGFISQDKYEEELRRFLESHETL